MALLSMDIVQASTSMKSQRVIAPQKDGRVKPHANQASEHDLSSFKSLFLGLQPLNISPTTRSPTGKSQTEPKLPVQTKLSSRQKPGGQSWTCAMQGSSLLYPGCSTRTSTVFIRSRSERILGLNIDLVGNQTT